jgi:hypothetical protein
MKFISLGIIVLLISCTSSNNIKGDFSKIINDKSCIIISCLKCDCIIGEINKISSTNPSLIENYDIFIDSDCARGLNPTIRYSHIEQASLDSISTDIYNMLVLKKEKNGVVKSTIIETKDSPKMEKILLAYQ